MSTAGEGRNQTLEFSTVACRVSVPNNLLPQYYLGYYEAQSNRNRFFPYDIFEGEKNRTSKGKGFKSRRNGREVQRNLEKQYKDYNRAKEEMKQDRMDEKRRMRKVGTRRSSGDRR